MLAMNFFSGLLSSFFVIFFLAVLLFLAQAPCTFAGRPQPLPATETNDQYLKFFEEVYQTMEKNYYYAVKREDFDRFLKKFEQDIYGRLKNENKKNNYILWRSAAMLVDYLKSPEDSFSAFIPPKPAKKFEEKVLGHRVDVGIEGKLTERGYLISRVEPRSDAYARGIREGDILRKIDGASVLKMDEKTIQEKLTPLIDTTVRLLYYDQRLNKELTVKVVSKEYFKQSVFLTPVHVAGVYCLEIRTFNRKTSDDLFRFLTMISRQEESSLILDLRGNPGGPPLAAREIAAFFLEPREEFAFFQKRGQPKAVLDVPSLPSEYRYQGEVVILVDKESGSASELFSGVMQKKGRAMLFGANTAGKVFLKSMFHFEDESMLLLVTGRGFFPDGGVFEYTGVTPDLKSDKTGEDLVNDVAQYLLINKKNSKF